MKTQKKIYRINTRINFDSNYNFASWCCAKSVKGVKQTKIYKQYLSQFNDYKIVGIQIEKFS